MAKELARIERTERGREARYHFIEFERQLQKPQSSKGMDRKFQRLNRLSQSMKVGGKVLILPTTDVINLVQAIRRYQFTISLCATPEHNLNHVWVNDIIEHIKENYR